MADDTDARDTASATTASATTASATTASAATVSATTACRPVMRRTDMPAHMQRDAMECAGRAFALHDNPSDVAAYAAHRFDEKYGPAWQAIVGRNLRCYVEHDRGTFAYFYYGQTAVVMFKSDAVQN